MWEDTYRMIPLEHMHYNLMDTSGILEHCLASHLEEESRVDTATTTIKSAAETLNLIWKKPLVRVDSFLLDAEKHSQSCGMRVNYCRGDRERTLTALFDNTWGGEMLDVSDFEVMYMVLSFIEVIAELFCRLHCGSITWFIFSFVDAKNLIYRRGKRTKWAQNGYHLLSKAIAGSMTRYHEVFLQFQRPGYKSLKFHLLEHLKEDMPPMRSKDYFQAKYRTVSNLVCWRSIRHSSQISLRIVS